MASKQDSLKSLPSVSRLLESDAGALLAARVGQGIATFFIRQALAEQRSALLSSSESNVSLDREAVSRLVLAHAERKALRTEPEARRAINATGVLLHTGLGRAPLGAKPLEAIEANAAYGVVQVNLEDNSRSLREKLIQELLAELIGAEAATTMNNNAAATFMLLHVLAAGKEVIVSRGQLVEIGGSYRMPDVMEQSGGILKEVGTTNKTHLSDYERAINENTGAILYVEPSNYVVQGFSSMPSIADLATLTKPRGIPLIADIGSGALHDLSKYGFKDISNLKTALSDGADVTCSSGDKL
ncbi:UNVERIFIED_CONTAM: hypothetical protein GTU68_027046, partial [Idotea baltica]|nr:hypothetical protein [Idotea baltica]